MPFRTVELAVIDTSVYIENFRSGRFTQRIADSPFLFRGISVVIHELLRGAKQTEEREFALDLAANCSILHADRKNMARQWRHRRANRNRQRL
jgi:predicted nucleic acid-binding protein